MNLNQAQHYATQILAWLAPYCLQIKIVGSIRRQRPECDDVDIIAVPRMELATKETDLFGATKEHWKNACTEFLLQYIRAAHPATLAASPLQLPTAPYWRGGGGLPAVEPKTQNEILLLQLPKCKLDIFFTTPEYWASLLVCRTGSAQHNIYLIEKAKANGKEWRPFRGVCEPSGELIPARTEAEIFAQIGAEWKEPSEREI